MAQAREAFAARIADVPAQDLVVIDESYATTKFTRLRGRAPRGERVVCPVPHGHWKLLTILAAMTLQGIQAAMTIDAATDGDVFEAFVKQVLVPTLRPGQVVVMDNLASHKVRRVVEAIEQAHCRVEFLPPYSPDLSPIESMWSKAKGHLRSTGARTVPALEHAVAEALKTITPSDCRGYFEHCGYTLPKS